jgi:chromosome segregation ATPase
MSYYERAEAQIADLRAEVAAARRARARLLVEVSKLQDRNCALEAAMKSAENGFLQFDLANFSTTNDALRAALAASQAEVERQREQLSITQRGLDAIADNYHAATRRAEDLEGALRDAVKALQTTADWLRIQDRPGWKGTVDSIAADAQRARAALSPVPGEGES